MVVVLGLKGGSGGFFGLSPARDLVKVVTAGLIVFLDNLEPCDP